MIDETKAPEPVVGIDDLERLPVWICVEQKNDGFIWGTRRKHKHPAFKAYYVCGTLFTSVTAKGEQPVPPPALSDWELIGWSKDRLANETNSWWMRTAEEKEYYYII